MTRTAASRTLALPAALISAAILTASQAAATPAYTTFDAPGSDTQPSGINNSGTVTGTFSGPSCENCGFVRNADGKISIFSPGCSPADGPLAINKKGTVVGTFSAGGRAYGFLRHRGGKVEVVDFFYGQDDGSTTLTALNDRGDVAGWEIGNSGLGGFVQAPDGGRSMYYQGDETWLRAINHSDMVAGEWTDYAGYHGFVGTPNNLTGNITTFDPTSSVATYSRSINDEGRVTGYYDDASAQYHGYVRTQDGTITNFDPEGSVNTYALSINAAGTITGWYADSNAVQHGFVRKPDGKITSFDVPGSSSTYAMSVNDAGAITGYYTDSSGTHGFLRTP